jgi:hypothetical protein
VIVEPEAWRRYALKNRVPWSFCNGLSESEAPIGYVEFEPGQKSDIKATLVGKRLRLKALTKRGREHVERLQSEGLGDTEV